ncbi:hypothetical protein ACQWHL_25250, partial [Salmonella enterica subsp. enterica serovar Infantis]
GPPAPDRGKPRVAPNGTQHAAGIPLGLEERNTQVNGPAEHSAVPAKTQNPIEAAIQKIIQKYVDD